MVFRTTLASQVTCSGKHVVRTVGELAPKVDSGSSSCKNQRAIGKWLSACARACVRVCDGRKLGTAGDRRRQARAAGTWVVLKGVFGCPLLSAPHTVAYALGSSACHQQGPAPSNRQHCGQLWCAPKGDGQRNFFAPRPVWSREEAGVTGSGQDSGFEVAPATDPAT